MWIVGYNIIIYKKAWEGIGLEKITQTEADAMLTMLKESLTQEITFPASGQQLEFKVKGFSSRRYTKWYGLRKYDYVFGKI